jgi:hypothetical protein
VEAREDARDAIVGACTLVRSAAVAALTFGHLAGVLVMVAATTVWPTAAVLGHAVLWWR